MVRTASVIAEINKNKQKSNIIINKPSAVNIHDHLPDAC